MLMDKLRKLFSRQEIPQDARDLVRDATEMSDVLLGLDELITRNEMAVSNINGEIEALEEVESSEMTKVRGGELAERSKNNVLRRIQRLRKQMDNLEERQRIYNRNITLQIHLVGRIQALEAMELRGVDEDRIDSILAEYEEELTNYQDVLDTEEIATGDLVGMLDDSAELSGLESEILGEPVATPEENTATADTSPSDREAASKESQASRPAAKESTATTNDSATTKPVSSPVESVEEPVPPRRESE